MSPFMLKAALLAVGANARYHDENHHWKMFGQFKKMHGKAYGGIEEESHRFQVFRSNMERAKKLQKESSTGASFGITKFSDRSPEEFKKMLGFKKSEKTRPKKKAMKKDKKFFKKTLGSVDWRDLSGVTAVKDQGVCGSCWAFSAVEQVESALALATGRSLPLSIEQVVDCDGYDFGCHGGDTLSAYQYMLEAGGIESEENMPYVSGDIDSPQCSADPTKFEAKITDYFLVADEPADEDTMMEIVQETPISVCIDAEAWQFYVGGVIGSDVCGTHLNHCAQIVGLQVGDYWLVRNSWGPEWGEDGYLRIKAGENACGIAEEATLVEVESTSYAQKMWEM